nr:SDR family NAD(P)-dependent oxidoreductase [Paenibacillus sp. GSMTC-2017]
MNRGPAAELEDVSFDRTSGGDIAIIGIAVKLPLADTLDQFVTNLQMGKDCVRPIPHMRKRDTDTYFKGIGTDPEGLAYGEAAYLDEIDKFDYPFFKLSPREASLLDPNQRIFLETAWRTIEDAGYGGGKLRGSRTGVYVGYGSDGDYLKLIRKVEPDAVSMSLAGNIRPIIASRLSYLMDLRGPSLLVDTTCSSSLVAVHLACQAIRNGECDSAIVGGIQLHLIPVREFEVGIESSTSRARTFDDRADGTGTGEGVVAMMLKPLDQALEARDNIYAVIKSSAMNQDGGSVGITAPNVEAQEAVIVDAWNRADIDPETIGYIETHGTATKLGDPIEVEGLKRAFRQFTDKRQFCAIGALKSNIGHLDNTAGIAGLLKAVLSLKHKCIYPTLHFDRPNRVIDFAESPLYVSDRLMEWEEGAHPRRCGVSSFGISGTNCHVILEEAPETSTLSKSNNGEYRLFVLSAQSESALQAYVDSSIAFIEHNSTVEFGDVCFTLSTGRDHYRYRIAIAAKSVDEVLDELRRFTTIGFTAYLNRSDDEKFNYLHAEIIDRFSSQQEVIRSTAEAVLTSYVQSDKRDRQLCGELGKLYAQGATYNWDRIYRQERRKRVSCPTYPFDRYRCWVKLTGTNLAVNPQQEMTKDDLVNEFKGLRGNDCSSFYHQRIWGHEPLTSGTRRNRGRQSILIFHDDQHVGSQLVSRWKATNVEVIEVVMGERYEQVNESAFVIQDELHDYERLLLDLAHVSINGVVDLRYTSMRAEAETFPEHELSIERSIYRFYRLTHALTRRANNDPLEITIVSAYADEVIADQARVLPEQFAMIGLSKAIGWENPHIRIRWIDLDDSSDSVESIWSELQYESNDYWSAYRDGKRFVERVDVLDVEEQSANSHLMNLDSEGIYVITGGLGNIGLLIAEHLAKEANGSINIALIGRNVLPQREQWSEIELRNEDDRLVQKLRAIRAIEAAGATVELIRTDAANKEQLSEAITELRQRYGRIAGIVHAAGIAEGNLLSRLSAEELQAVIASKVTGTWLLDHLTRQDKPDFFVLFSSAITLVGGIGSGPYTAGNAYLDGYTAYRNRLGLRTLTINWPAWEQLGVAGDADFDESKEMFCLMPAEHGIKAFRELLSGAEATPIQQAIVGKWNRKSSLFALGEMLPFRQSEQVGQALALSSHANNVQSNIATTRQTKAVNGKSLAAPKTYSEIEQAVTEAWKLVLGYEELDINANFFEIGGDSILIVKVHHYVDECFPDLTTIADLFSYPTITRITSHLYSVITSRVDKAEPKRESIEADSFNDSILALFGRMEQGELSIDDAVDLFRELEVANG